MNNIWWLIRTDLYTSGIEIDGLCIVSEEQMRDWQRRLDEWFSINESLIISIDNINDDYEFRSKSDLDNSCHFLMISDDERRLLKRLVPMSYGLLPFDKIMDWI